MDRKIWLLNYGADQVVGFSGVRFDRPFTPPRHRFTKFDSSWSVGPEAFSVVIPVCFSKLTGHQRGFECFVRHDTQSIINTPPCQEKKVASSIYPLCGRGTTGPTIPVDPSVSCETALFRPRPCPILDLDIDRKWRPCPVPPRTVHCCFQDLLRKALVKQSRSLQFDLASIRNPTGHLPHQKGSCKQTLPTSVTQVRWFPFASHIMFCFGLNYGTLIKKHHRILLLLHRLIRPR